jgi:hypothetical protein
MDSFGRRVLFWSTFFAQGDQAKAVFCATMLKVMTD